MTTGNAHFVPRSTLRRELSIHADRRSAQRGIPADSVPLVKAYGKKENDGRGGIRYLMTKDAVARLCRVFGHTQKIEALTGVYVVMSADGTTVITMGHYYN